MNQAASVFSPRCAACGQVIGVYEPLATVVEGEVVETSRAAAPNLAGRECFHLHCHALLAARAS